MYIYSGHQPYSSQLSGSSGSYKRVWGGGLLKGRFSFSASYSDSSGLYTRNYSESSSGIGSLAGSEAEEEMILTGSGNFLSDLRHVNPDLFPCDTYNGELAYENVLKGEVGLHLHLLLIR